MCLSCIQMKMSIILKYLQAFGWSWMWLTIAAYLGQNAIAIGQNLWLSTWTTEAKQIRNVVQWKQLRNHKLTIYGLLGLAQGKLNHFLFQSLFDLVFLNLINSKILSYCSVHIGWSGKRKRHALHYCYNFVHTILIIPTVRL